ncbi:alpha-hydroxy-acid oxidizing protein [Sphingomonas populi]|uniref:Alpha-hydroxy-acid oxidizing protein n=1 Tax=Sphingomonas populi TaxID=2484750 RepID=A0A4Q6XX18_9SPHN|nr:alpha-hydroxy acid oxidase [Sphingomonas populi]RZF64511.1 alpha-hydroxy-acid oxidizing protein [Sphingomonas populi]
MVGDVTPLPPLTAIPPDLQTLADYERLAERHMPAASWAHIQSGSATTLARNRTAFDGHPLLPRMLADLRGGHTRLSLLGRVHHAPILFAPVAYHRLAHPEGELACVRASVAMGVGMVVSTLSSVPLEAIAEAARDAARTLGVAPAPLWFQLYLQEDRAVSAELVARAEAAGYEAIVLTVDASIKTSGFTLPPGVTAANLPGGADRRQTSAPGGRILFGTPLADGAPTWDDVAWLRASTRLPIILKGLLAAEDARVAIAHGMDAIIVSNHGGRTLDGAPSAVDVLPAMVDAVAGAVPLLIDGGVRTGTDIVKALALGGAAVLVGRPQLHGLAVAGMAGVAHVAHILRAELELAMAQLGCPTLDRIGPACLFTRAS